MTVDISRCGYTKTTPGNRTVVCIAPARSCKPEPGARHVFIFTDTEECR